jgi:hypothetical protein
MRFCEDHEAEILCPKNQDDILLADWLPFGSGTGGEWWLRCPTCKSEVFILNRHPEEEL